MNPKENVMRTIQVDKVTLSIATHGEQDKIERAYALAKRLTGRKPVKTLATRKARTFRIRRRLPIGVKVTLRDKAGVDFLKKVSDAVDGRISASSFDDWGNFSFGLKEYLEIPGEKYDPRLGVIGMNINVTLSRPGFRVMRRKIKRCRIPERHRIKRQEAIEFVEKELKMRVV